MPLRAEQAVGPDVAEPVGFAEGPERDGLPPCGFMPASTLTATGGLRRPHRTAHEAPAGYPLSARSALRRSPGDASPTMPWMMFGLDGREPEEISSAVVTGYRRFDTAEAYDAPLNRTETLAKALADNKIERSGYEILYKFEPVKHEPPEALEKRLRAVAALFEGRLDGILIHNYTTAALEAWATLRKLKADGVTAHIGVGNITPDHVDQLESSGMSADVTIVENSATSLLTSTKLQHYVRSGDRGAYIYNIVDAAKSAGLTIPDDPKTFAAELTGLIYQLTVMMLNPKRSTAIMSSSNPERQSSTLEATSENPTGWEAPEGDVAAAMDKTKEWAGAKDESANEEVPGMTPRLKEKLTALADQPRIRNDMLERIANPVSQGTPTSRQDRVTAEINTYFEGIDIEPVKLPIRKRLLAVHRGKSLRTIMSQLLGPDTCGPKTAQELITALTIDAKDWDGLVVLFSDQVIKPI